MSKMFPWDYHPDLTADRLQAVAALIADGRQMAVELYDEAAGDDGWTLGCRAFWFGCARILRLAQSGTTPWLNMIDGSRRFIFTIGAVPVRIYRGEANEPTDRTLRQSHSELRQLSLLFPEDHDGRDLAYRFAVETDVDGSVLAIRFVGLRGQSPVLEWDVPLGGLGATGGVGRPPSDPVELPAPPVGVRREHRKDDASGQ